MMDDLDLVNLMKQAKVAAATGDRADAVALYQRALNYRPDNIEAMMALVALLDDRDEKRRYLQHVLSIAPYHEEARAILSRLDGNQSAAQHSVDEYEILHCHYHPDRETRLRCNKCGKPICMECAIRTPVGYRCKECVRQQQDKFYTATRTDQLKGVAAAFAGGALLGVTIFLLALFLGGFGFFAFLAAFFLGPALGSGIAELIRKAMGKRRSRQFPLIATSIVILVGFVISIFSGAWLIIGLALFMAAGTLYARLKV